MNQNSVAHNEQGINLGQAALVAGLGLLVMTILGPIAELVIYPQLVIRGDVAQTVANIQARGDLFLTGFFAYFILFIMDIVVAWALYLLLRPVNAPLSLLVAWFRLVYTVIAFVAAFKLVTVYRLVNNPELLSAFSDLELQSHVLLLLKSFRYEWSASLILFGIYLLMLGGLVFRASYIPKTMAIALWIAGAGWVLTETVPLFAPGVDLSWLMITFLGELVFMGWLIVRGRKLSGVVGV